MRSDVVVFLVPSGERESFVVFERDWFLPPRARWDWTDTSDFLKRAGTRLADALRHTPPLDERDVRAALEARGFAADEIDAQIRRARNAPKMFGASPTVYERTTALGATNEHGQTVVSKSTVTPINADDWLYTLRCSVCGAEHESKAVDVHRARCPHADQHGS